MFVYMTREQWKARPPIQPRANIPEHQFMSLEVHHSATGVMPAARAARSFQNYHMDVKGWKDIFYNWLIHPDGTIVEGRGWGTSAHVAAPRMFVAFIGNYQTTDELSAAAKGSFEQIRRVVLSLHKNVPPFVDWHRTRDATTCPGDNIVDWIKTRNMDQWSSTTIPIDIDNPTNPEVPPVVDPSNDPELIASRWQINQIEDELEVADDALERAGTAVLLASNRVNRAMTRISRLKDK